MLKFTYFNTTFNHSSNITTRDRSTGVRLALLISLLCMFGVGCTPKEIQIFGQVTQFNGIPIDKAKVSSIPKTDIVNTDRKGYFRLYRKLTTSGKPAPITPGRYRIVIAKEGYEKLQFDLVVKSGKVWANKRIMQAEQASVEEVAPTDNGGGEVQVNTGAGPKMGI